MYQGTHDRNCGCSDARQSVRIRLDEAYYNQDVFREAVGGLMKCRTDGRRMGGERSWKPYGIPTTSFGVSVPGRSKSDASEVALSILGSAARDS